MLNWDIEFDAPYAELHITVEREPAPRPCRWVTVRRPGFRLTEIVPHDEWLRWGRPEYWLVTVALRARVLFQRPDEPPTGLATPMVVHHPSS